MGYNFTIKNGLRVKKDGRYPWPLKPEHQRPGTDDANRTIELFTDDVLTKDPDTGRYMVHTGLGCFGIVLTDDEVEPIGKDSHLRLI